MKLSPETYNVLKLVDNSKNIKPSLLLQSPGFKDKWEELGQRGMLDVRYKIDLAGEFFLISCMVSKSGYEYIDAYEKSVEESKISHKLKHGAAKTFGEIVKYVLTFCAGGLAWWLLSRWLGL